MPLYNFSPGPSYIAPEVVSEYQKRAEDFLKTGVPIWSTSHRSKQFLDGVLQPLNKLVRDLLQVPDNYQIFWTRDGATEQWARIARNFPDVGYIDTGVFAQRAAKAYRDAHSTLAERVFLSGEESKYAMIPKGDTIDFTGDLLHVTCNNTIYGTTWHKRHLKTLSPAILLMDATSMMFSCVPEWEEHNIGMYYGTTTKQLGGPGACMIIIRDDLLEKSVKVSGLADSERYSVLAEKDSGLYTSNVQALLMALVSLEYYEYFLGSIDNMEELTLYTSNILYDVMEEFNDVYIPHATLDSRSRMNVVFYLRDSSRTDEFLQLATKQGLCCLKGHAALPNSIRASLYNMQKREAVDALARFMREFAQTKSGTWCLIHFFSIEYYFDVLKHRSSVW